MKNNEKIIIKFVQELLLDSEESNDISPNLISQKIDLVLKMKPNWGKDLNREEVITELILRFSLWIGKDSTIKNDEGHKEWLNAERKKDWRYWGRYQDYMEGKLSVKMVDALDRSSDEILGILEDPLRDGVWDRRGLVVGYVQSGKTSNYTALITKAADAGYKIIIVLAGMHNNLRLQTQIRLDEDFLGYETNSNLESPVYIGVGENGRDANLNPNCATYRDELGDFNSKIANHLAVTPEQRPWLFVVKKNKRVLEELLRWIRNHVADSKDQESERAIVTNLPLLMIDDEADNGSVDTGEQYIDSNGVADEDYQPKTINRNIRRILHSFTRSAYIGYTATPFANIFIHEQGETKEEGPDLFPSSFIKTLAVPSNYIGPVKVFGLMGNDGRIGGLPLIRVVDEKDPVDNPWMPIKHKNQHIPIHNGVEQLPPSLVEAIDSFILATTIRKFRGQSKQHCSMLIHVTRYISTQQNVLRQTEEHLSNIRQRILRGTIDSERLFDRLKNLFDNDFLPTTKEIKKRLPDLVPENNINWSDIKSLLPEVIQDIKVKSVNGGSKDVLDYENHKENGLKVIAVGGDKLSRGLTLEGLTVSYFLRSSKMYDTLMQMGRWFGYRPNYLDVSRIYITSELAEWFGDITDAAEELREEFEIMQSNGSTPRKYGLKVQSHPVLTVTSKLKMRTAKNLLLNFSGHVVETISLFNDLKILKENFEATEELISKLNNPEIDPVRDRFGSVTNWNGSYYWENVPGEEIYNFFLNYKTHPQANKVVSSCIAEFLSQMMKIKELTNWSVALIGTGKEGKGSEHKIAKLKVKMLHRGNKGKHDDRYSIGRLLSPVDETIDMTADEWLDALKRTQTDWKPNAADDKEPKIPNGPYIRIVRGERHPERGLLIIYLLDPKDVLPIDAPPVATFAISFPTSNSGLKAKYFVNNVAWENEYGPSE